MLKQKLRESYDLLQKYIIENNHLKEDNQYLRKLLWTEMTRDNPTTEDVEMGEAMEDIVLLN